jgi:hypothetical protein
MAISRNQLCCLLLRLPCQDPGVWLQKNLPISAGRMVSFCRASQMTDEGQTQVWTLFWMIDYQRLAGSVSAALLE